MEVEAADGHSRNQEHNLKILVSIPLQIEAKRRRDCCQERKQNKGVVSASTAKGERTTQGWESETHSNHYKIEYTTFHNELHCTRARQLRLSLG